MRKFFLKNISITESNELTLSSETFDVSGNYTIYYNSIIVTGAYSTNTGIGICIFTNDGTLVYWTSLIDPCTIEYNVVNLDPNTLYYVSVNDPNQPQSSEPFYFQPSVLTLSSETFDISGNYTIYYTNIIVTGAYSTNPSIGICIFTNDGTLVYWTSLIDPCTIEYNVVNLDPSTLYYVSVNDPNQPQSSEPFYFQPTQPTSDPWFYLSQEMDNFYESNVTHSDDGTKIITYGGLEVGQSTSEAFSYFLNYIVNKYILCRTLDVTNSANTSITYATLIIKMINTLTNLYNNNQNTNTTRIYFPVWSLNNSNNYDSSAQDSNLEILKSFLRLILFDANDNNLNTISASTITPLKTDYYNIIFSNTLDIVIHQVILILSCNVLSDGNFKIANNNSACFAETCLNYGLQYEQGPAQSVIDQGHFDYINFTYIIYLLHYHFIYNISEGQLLSTIQINDTYLAPNAPGNMSNYTTTKTNLLTYINWINTRIKYNDDTNGKLTWGDGYDANINRLSYQICELFILLNKDIPNIITASQSNAYWTTLGMNTYTNLLNNSIEYFINLEINYNSLYLEFANNLYTPYYTLDYANNDGSLASGYLRQITYLIYLSYYPSCITHYRDSSSTTKYMENYINKIDEYLGIGDQKLVGALQDQINTWSDNQSTTSNSINFFNNGYGNVAWIDNNTQWDNNHYWGWVTMALHLNNYRLFTYNV
jgi:hypothetical protein